MGRSWITEVELGVPGRRTWCVVGALLIRPGRCRSCRHEGLVGPAGRVELSVRDEELGVRDLDELGVLEGVLGASVSATLAFRGEVLGVPGLSVYGSGRKNLAVPRVLVF